MAPQGHDSAARAADVSEQKLQDSRCPDELRSKGVLGPTDGVGETGGPVATGVFRDGPRQILEVLDTDAAHVLHHLRRITGVMPLYDLENGPRILESIVALDFRMLQGRPATSISVAGGARRCIGPVLRPGPGLINRTVPFFRIRPR